MNNGKQDIFDRLMKLPLLRKAEPFYKKNKEILLYVFFGGFAVLLNIGLFQFFHEVLNINELISNAISWVLCVLFQYWTNSTWVFDGKAENRKALLGQMVSFFGGRIFTLVVEELILAIFITWLGFNPLIIKTIAQIIIIILNYIISKKIVFKKRGKMEDSQS